MKFFKANGTLGTLAKSHKYIADWDSKTRSKFQDKVKEFIRPAWEFDVVFEELPVLGTRLSIDIYNASKKIAIEVQGRQHFNYVKHFHKNRQGFIDQLKRDEIKHKFCRLNDIHLIEIYSEKEITKEFFNKNGIII